MILGNNGYVWISPLDDEEDTLTDGQTDRVVTEDKPPKQVDNLLLTMLWFKSFFGLNIFKPV